MPERGAVAFFDCHSRLFCVEPEIMLRRFFFFLATLLFLTISVLLSAKEKNPEDRVRDAAKRSTLDQPGTPPFHLKAILAPTGEQERGSSRTGEIEIWWTAPKHYRREVRSPEFHQIEIVDGDHRWQKNEGDYFPEWLRGTAIELINPIPNLEEALEGVRGADEKSLMGTTDYQWIMLSSDGKVQSGMGAAISLTDKTGLLSYCGGRGWDGDFSDYKKFHDLIVARTVNTAKVVILEDLPIVPNGFFDAQAPGGDPHPIQTVVVDELDVRKNLLPMKPVEWPALPNGPLEGATTTTVVVDRTGKVRELGPIISNNSAISDAAKSAIATMQFKPYLVNGEPVQVISRITLAFKTSRPVGTETFDSAQNYFERGRKVGFLAAGNTPYVLKAKFQTVVRGSVQEGQYEDTWISETQWRREARIGDSRYIRTQNGETHYQLAEGQDAPLLRLVFKLLEPIPAIDTFTESDWRIKRDTVDGVKTIRVLTGYEGPDGQFDPKHVRGFWFDDHGNLLRVYSMGLDTRRSNFEDFAEVKVARELSVLKDQKLGMHIEVTDVSSPGGVSPKIFELHGHEWKRQFTDEIR